MKNVLQATQARFKLTFALYDGLAMAAKSPVIDCLRHFDSMGKTIRTESCQDVFRLLMN